MRIAVCDDSKEMLDLLCEKISKAFSNTHTDVSTNAFSSGTDLLAVYKNDPFDVVFLDIDMPTISGFEVAEQINKSGSALIVFVTSHDELVYSSIKFQPFRFIRKTRLDDELIEAVEAIGEKIQKHIVEKKIKFLTKDEEIFVLTGDIEYIEVFGHWLRVVVNNSNDLECYGSLSELEKLLCPAGFIRTHKSYLVNFKYIYSIGKAQVTLDSGTEIPLSRYKANEVKEKFTDYLRSTL